MSYKEGNDGAADLLKYADGVTTISPTWFRLTGNEGDITSFADSSYVDTMHARGVDVWGLVSNFEESVDTTKILSSTSTRKKLIAKLIDEAKRVGMDGINVDFETLATECGPHYIEFIRELSASCRRNSLVLSVDNYVPAAYNAFMDCEEQGKVVDYVIIMAYDEHYAGSEEAGSVSSIGYVENGIKDMAEMVPKDKIICAIPFYTRLWKITDGVLSSEALSMRSAEETVSANDATYV
jgi:spore germination protein YaaH